MELRNKEFTPTQTDYQVKIDCLLDKIAVDGVESLSLTQKNWLNLASKGSEYLKKQHIRALIWLNETLGHLKMMKYVTQSGRVIHLQVPETGITLLTVFEVRDDVFKLFIRQGLVEALIEFMYQALEYEEAELFFSEYIKMQYGFDVHTVTEMI